jgi:hypothetical protein
MAVYFTSGRRVLGTACILEEVVGPQLVWMLSEIEKFVAYTAAVQFTDYYLIIKTEADCVAQLASCLKLLGFFPGDRAART